MSYNPLTDTIPGQCFEAKMGLLKCRMCMRSHPFFVSDDGHFVFIGDMNNSEVVKEYCEKNDVEEIILQNNNIVICSCGTGLRVNLEPVKTEEAPKEKSNLIKV